MKIQEIRKKTENDLQKLLADLQENVRSTRFKIISKEIKNHQVLRQAKKDVARILTVLREKKHGS